MTFTGLKTYVIHQNQDQIKRFGSIAQSSITADKSGIGYFTIRPWSVINKQFLPKYTHIASFDYVHYIEPVLCHEKHYLVVSQDIWCPSNSYIGIPVMIDTASVPKCQLEHHAVNIVPTLPSFHASIEDQTRYVLVGRFVIYLKSLNGHIFLKKGRLVATAQCCHGHYKDSMYY